MGRVVQMKKRSRWWHGVDPDDAAEMQYNGVDPQIECQMNVVEEMKRLERRTSSQMRRLTMQHIMERFALEDQILADAAEQVEQ